MDIYDGSISVSALNGYIKSLMERDDFLSGVAIRGEISNFKRNISGHLYFSLKDEGATVSAVMFRSAAARLSFVPRDGMKVTAFGRVSLYEKTGQYQVYIETMKDDGAGELARAYEALRLKLESEGLFSAERKKKLPRLPKRIGIVTSPTGAAIRDMLNVTARRFPLADVVIFPSAVQGSDAPPELCAGVEYFNAVGGVDVIIIGRGGGSIEDLWSFNDERVVRAVAASRIPIVSAVGHETDFTLCDFAADKRAPTPSAAAELVVPDIAAIENFISQSDKRLERAIALKLNKLNEDVLNLEKIISLNSPIARLERSRLALINLHSRIDNATRHRLGEAKRGFGEISARLSALDPLKVLSRGYGAVEDKDGNIISSASRVSEGQNIGIIMSDGKIRATVFGVEMGESERNLTE